MGCASTLLDERGRPTGFVCGAGIEACAGCGVVAVALCDWPIGRGRTCDLPLCGRCRVPQGGDLRDLDYCPQHALAAAGRATPPSTAQLALWPTPID
jgi:hypothetical protein